MDTIDKMVSDVDWIFNSEKNTINKSNDENNKKGENNFAKPNSCTYICNRLVA